MHMTPTIRLATRDDLISINDIYNYYVALSTCTYQEIPSTDDERLSWFKSHGEKHPITVAIDNNVVLGWASLGEFRARAAYRYTVENTVYVHRDFHRRGIGSFLLADSIKRAKDLGHHSIIAAICKSGPSFQIRIFAGRALTRGRVQVRTLARCHLFAVIA
jgi:L-amino acid N-acyltransferase YncA